MVLAANRLAMVPERSWWKCECGGTDPMTSRGFQRFQNIFQKKSISNPNLGEFKTLTDFSAFFFF